MHCKAHWYGLVFNIIHSNALELQQSATVQCIVSRVQSCTFTLIDQGQLHPWITNTTTTDGLHVDTTKLICVWAYCRQTGFVFCAQMVLMSICAVYLPLSFKGHSNCTKNKDDLFLNLLSTALVYMSINHRSGATETGRLWVDKLRLVKYQAQWIASTRVLFLTTPCMDTGLMKQFSRCFNSELSPISFWLLKNLQWHCVIMYMAHYRETEKKLHLKSLSQTNGSILHTQWRIASSCPTVNYHMVSSTPGRLWHVWRPVLTAK